MKLADAQNWAVVCSVVLAAIVLAARRVGWLRDRAPSQEPRAEELWRSEAEAQTARAERLEADLDVQRAKLDVALGEIILLKAELQELQDRPDLTEILTRMDLHRSEMTQLLAVMTQTLTRIAVAVVPPENIRDD